jgi:hypothetical protein
MVERLARAGLVRRETAGRDRCAVAIRLTPAGERLPGRIPQGIVQNYRKILEKLSPRDRARLARAVEEWKPSPAWSKRRNGTRIIGAAPRSDPQSPLAPEQCAETSAGSRR